MTPLFHAIALETTKPVRDRKLIDPSNIARELGDYHFFDCSAVTQSAQHLGRQFARNNFNGCERLAFLPAPKTAIEIGLDEYGNRQGVLIQETDGYAVCHMVGINGRHPFISRNRIVVGLSRDTFKCYYDQVEHNSVDDEEAAALGEAVCGLLALINTPRMIGRKQHIPHAGLQRKLAAAKGMVGKFPLHAWTEIVLDIRPTIIDAGGDHEAHLTGERAWHFVRQHLRIIGGVVVQINGRREVIGGRAVTVVAHHRGNPALGMKQSRYVLRDSRAA